ncbi:putative DCC family thiol-disulfide oxidoreductase YuxK [Bacillus tianshenii]|uniref:DCC family thiol-disulfide oxidoreductase YuxK n=1 Tax=Sutcliffiella tianshenii TaxID=1463404 RepID=A0ABS2P493_9BACI|nr:thiol-disulfide oxidoreductase DCC family protein [Bacillus tianshenii]MBM7621699.1 putative DCC family thiol-disulfide oxidoreductase YuxK [Bacillus tianshenii]
MPSKNVQHIQPVLLFDGVCNMCNSLVIFVIRNDKKGRFKFASLQSEQGQLLLKSLSLPSDDFDTFYLIEGNRRFTRSSAGLKVLKGLDGPWKLLYPLILVPKPIRDSVYRYVAKNRYRWFGKKDECMLPSPEMKKRFL